MALGRVPAEEVVRVRHRGVRQLPIRLRLHCGWGRTASGGCAHPYVDLRADEWVEVPPEQVAHWRRYFEDGYLEVVAPAPTSRRRR